MTENKRERRTDLSDFFAEAFSTKSMTVHSPGNEDKPSQYIMMKKKKWVFGKSQRD